MTTRQTPSQTVGPFFAYGLTPEQYGYRFASAADAEVAGADAQGERIRIQGRVIDGDGAPIPDAMLELWQADALGRYPAGARGQGSNTGFRGFGRVGTGTDAACRFHFDTVKPGSVDGRQAPHVDLIVFMRGLLSHAYTRLYFADELDANAVDPLLASLPQDRRHTLIASRADTPTGVVYELDIHMQGERETVFLDL